MIKSIWRIGNVFYNKVNLMNIIMDPISPKIIIEIIIDLNCNNHSLNVNKKCNTYRYLFVEDGSKMPNYALTYKTSFNLFMNPEKLKKDKERLIDKWILLNKEHLGYDVNKMCEYIEQNFDLIVKDIKNELDKLKNNSQIDKKDTILISFFYKKNRIYYPINYIPSNYVINRFFEKMNSNKKGDCILCGKKNVDLYGNTLQKIGLQFYTFNQKGFAPGFDENATYKKLPICKECATKLLIGKRFIDEYFKFNLFSNLNYYLILDVSTSDKNLFLDLINKYRYLKKKENSFFGLINKEDKIIEFLKKVKEDNPNVLNYISLDIIIFEIKQERFLIHKIIEGMKPSDIFKIHEKSELLKKKYNFSEKRLSWWTSLIFKTHNKDEKNRKVRCLSYVLTRKKLPKNYYYNLFLNYLDKNKELNKNSKINNKRYRRNIFKYCAKETIAFLELVEVI